MGRTKKLVKDILELNKGSLVVLDKLAGEQVDLFVNGQCIAKGDVVVVDDNFGIRITQILSVDRINQSAPMRKHEVKSSKKYEERQLGSPVDSLFRVVSSIMIGLAIIFVILLLK